MTVSLLYKEKHALDADMETLETSGDEMEKIGKLWNSETLCTHCDMHDSVRGRRLITTICALMAD